VTLRYVNNGDQTELLLFRDVKESGKAIPDSCSEGTLEWVKSDVLFEREMPRSSRECLRHYLDVGKFNDSVYVMVSTGGLEDRRL